MRKPGETATNKISLVKAIQFSHNVVRLLIMSLTSVYIHIVFRTKLSVPALPLDGSEKLYKYIWGISRNLGVKLLRINGMEDHVHLFIRLPASVSVAEFVRTVKANSSRWLKHSGAFPNFVGWAAEYAAFSYAEKDKAVVINYVKNQREHHKRISFSEEIENIFREFGAAEKIPYFWRDWRGRVASSRLLSWRCGLPGLTRRGFST